MKKIIAGLLLLCCFLCSFPKTMAADALPYERIVILSDAHYPTKTEATKNPKQFLSRVENKWKAVDTVNSWKDVSLVVFTGDIVEKTGSKKNYADAKQFVAAIKKPTAVIAGNHEFCYRDTLRNGKLQRASMTEREAKLQRFARTFGLSSLYYTKEMGPYLLVFLSPEAASGKYATEMSPVQLHWLDSTLAANRDKPTIIFFHAPLAGTLKTYKPFVNSPNFIAQPAATVEKILLEFPQVKLWVSGHTHTPATNSSFAAPINWFHGKILDVQNPTLDGKTIWINSLYLYADKIVIKTFDLKSGKDVEGLRREVRGQESGTRSQESADGTG